MFPKPYKSTGITHDSAHKIVEQKIKLTSDVADPDKRRRKLSTPSSGEPTTRRRRQRPEFKGRVKNSGGQTAAVRRRREEEGFARGKRVGGVGTR